MRIFRKRCLTSINDVTGLRFPRIKSLRRSAVRMRSSNWHSVSLTLVILALRRVRGTRHIISGTFLQVQPRTMRRFCKKTIFMLTLMRFLMKSNASPKSSGSTTRTTQRRLPLILISLSVPWNSGDKTTSSLRTTMLIARIRTTAIGLRASCRSMVLLRSLSNSSH